MTYGDFKDLPQRTASDKLLRDKTFNVAKDPKYDGYQRGFASMVYKIFDKKSSGSGVKNEVFPSQQLQELCKPIIRKFKKRKVCSSFKDKVLQEILDESGHKPNRVCVENQSEFYNRSMKSWLQDNDI